MMRIAWSIVSGSSTSTYSTFADLNIVSLLTAPCPVYDIDVCEIFSVPLSDSDCFMPVAELFSLTCFELLRELSPFFFFFFPPLSLGSEETMLMWEARASASIKHLGSFILSTIVLYMPE